MTLTQDDTSTIECLSNELVAVSCLRLLFYDHQIVSCSHNIVGSDKYKCTVLT